jgi:hypothetical protein
MYAEALARDVKHAAAADSALNQGTTCPAGHGAHRDLSERILR